MFTVIGSNFYCQINFKFGFIDLLLQSSCFTDLERASPIRMWSCFDKLPSRCYYLDLVIYIAIFRLTFDWVLFRHKENDKGEDSF